MNNYRLLTLINGLFFAAIGISSPLITLFFEEELGTDKSRIAVILTSVVLIMLIGNYAWGRLSDWTGRRKPIWVGGLFGVALTSLMLSQAPTIWWAWIIRMLGSLATAAYTTLSLAIMADVFSAAEYKSRRSGKLPFQKGRQMGFYRGLGSFSFAIGAVFGGQLADAVSLRAIFIACALLYLLAGVLAMGLKEGSPSEDSHLDSSDEPLDGVDDIQSTDTDLPTGGRQLPYLFLFGVVLWTMAHSASASMWPNYMRYLGYSKSWVGSLWGLAAFVEFPAMYIAGALSDVAGTVVMLAAGGFFIAAVNTGYLLIAAYLPALLSIQVVRGFGFGSYTTSAMTFTTDFGLRRTRGRTSGLFYTFASGGQLLGSYLGGTLVDRYGFQFMYGFCAVSAFCAGLSFIALRRQFR